MIERTYFIDRADLLSIGFSPKAARQFEEFQLDQATTSEAVSANIEGTTALRDATFITLSPNAELPNERVLTLGSGLAFDLTEGGVRLDTTGLVQSAGGHVITLVAAGASEIVIPLSGYLVTRAATETLENKTLATPKVSGLVNAVDDAAAATAGVPVLGLYRDGSTVKVRVA